MRRAKKVASLARVLPIDNVEGDGLIITHGGSYQRIILCERLPNALTADESRQLSITRALTEICRLIPDHGALSITAQTDPIPLDEALGEDQRKVKLAQQQDRHAGREELAAVRERLFLAQKQSVINAAGSDQPAVAARWWVTVPYQPRAEDPSLADARHARAGPRPPDVQGPPGRRVREPAADTADRGGAQRRRDRHLPARRPADARVPMGAASPRRRALRRRAEGAPRTADSRRRRADHGDHRRAGQRAAPADPPRAMRCACARRDRRVGQPPAAPRRRDARGDPAPRDPAAADEPVVAASPALLPAAGDRHRAHPRRQPSPRARAPAAAVATADRRGGLQEPAQPAGDGRRARGARRGPGGRRRAVGRDRRDRVRRRGLLLVARPARRRAGIRPAGRRRRPPVPCAHERARGPRPPAVPARVRVDAPDRRRRARRPAQLRTPQHRPLPAADLELVRQPRRADPRASSDPMALLERIDPFDPLFRTAVTLLLGPSGRRQDRADERAARARDLAGHVGVDHRPLLHPRRARLGRGLGALRPAARADPRRPTRPGRLADRRRDLPVGRAGPRRRARRADRVPARAARAVDRRDRASAARTVASPPSRSRCCSARSTTPTGTARAPASGRAKPCCSSSCAAAASTSS